MCMSLNQPSKPDATIVVLDYVGLRPAEVLHSWSSLSLPVLGTKEQQNHTKSPMLVLLAVEGPVYAKETLYKKVLIWRQIIFHQFFIFGAP